MKKIVLSNLKKKYQYSSLSSNQIRKYFTIINKILYFKSEKKYKYKIKLNKTESELFKLIKKKKFIFK